MAGGRRGWWAAALIVVSLAGATCGTSTGTGSPATVTAPGPAASQPRGTPTVVLFGDSLSVQAAPDFDRLIDAAGAEARNDVYGGTALCAWLPAIRRAAAAHPQAAVLEFVGTTFSSCMQGCAYESPAAIDEYCFDMQRAIAAFRAVGAHVFLIGTPISYAQWLEDDPRWNDLNRAFAGFATEYPHVVTYVDAGAAVEGTDGAFVWTLPCLATEPCLGPTVDGVRSNVVRAPDGLHFCTPVTAASGCDGYSSGAFRFASAMAGPVLRFLHLTTTPAGSPGPS